jgi:hypothetical protein
MVYQVSATQDRFEMGLGICDCVTSCCVIGVKHGDGGLAS